MYLPAQLQAISFPLSAGGTLRCASLLGLRHELADLAERRELPMDDDGLHELLRVAHDPDDGWVAEPPEVMTFARLTLAANEGAAPRLPAVAGRAGGLRQLTSFAHRISSDLVRPLPGRTTINRYRRWFDYETDAHAKVLASFDTVPSAGRGTAEFPKVGRLAGSHRRSPEDVALAAWRDSDDDRPALSRGPGYRSRW